VSTDRDRVKAALSAADFPAGKDDLLAYAERAGADNDTIRALRSIPPVDYANLTEVLQSVPTEEPITDAERAQARRTHAKPGLSELARDIPPNPIVEEVGENRGS
jgi:hypothetical protein